MVVVLAFGTALTYTAYRFVTGKMFEARVRAAFPHVCEEARGQREQIIAAIEAYRHSLGFYPPDHVFSRRPLVISAATNQLLYELVGTIYDPTNETFTAKGFERVERRLIKEFFNIDGFKNSATRPEELKRFLSLEPASSREIHDDPDINALAFSPSFEGIKPEVTWEFDASFWNYVSTAPTNNPGRFDLWIEIRALDKKIVIGNWNTAQ